MVAAKLQVNNITEALDAGAESQVSRIAVIALRVPRPGPRRRNPGLRHNNNVGLQRGLSLLWI